MAWIQNLKLWQKFALLGALALALCTPLAAMLLVDEWQLRETATSERDGIPAVGAMLRLLRDTQVHRGMSAATLAGNAEVAAKRPAQAAAVDQALARVQASLERYADQGTKRRVQQMAQDWQGLRNDLAQQRVDGSPASFRRHTALVAAQLRLLGDVSDLSRMSLDPEPDTYHLVALVTDTLPRMSELLGQSRAIGAAALQAGQLLPEQRALLQGNLVQIEQLRDTTARHFDQAFSGAASSAPATVELGRSADAAVVAAATLVRQQLLGTDKPSLAPTAYFKDMTAHIDAQFKLGDASFALLGSALDARVDGVQRRLVLAIAAALLTLGLGLALIVGINRGSQRSLRDAELALTALARGELDHAVRTQAQDEFGHMARQVGDAMQQLAQLVGEIKQAGSALGTASVQIASGNADLSGRTEQSASSLQQAASSLEQITAAVRHNADSAQQAAGLAGQASEVAANGGELIGRLVATMEQISTSSQRIADITGVIDGIAFQTNILALNAAVEAARAGDAGRGFAVVASEVRALAQRSAQAAREIKTLIGQSVETVDGGARLVGDARQTMHDIVQQAREVSTLVAEIGHATSEQASGIGQVNSAVGQLEQSTQQNAALVEESAAAADSLRQQAERLVQVVGRFRVAEAAGH